MVYLKTWIASVAHHPPLVYEAVFLSSLIESLAIVGLLFPGTMIIFGLGALVAAGNGGLRPLKRFLSDLFGRQEEEWFLLFLFSILFFAGWGFLGVLQDVLAKDPLATADQAVYHFFQSLRTPWTDQVLVAVTELGDSLVNVSLASAVLLALLFKRRYRAAGFWALALVGGAAGIQLLKAATRLPRPTALYQGASAYSFPSGHTSMSVILYGFLAILISRGHSIKMRWGLFVSVFMISFIIAASRLYLGAHWLSDVLGGLLIGATWTALLGIVYLKGKAETVPHRLLGIVTVLTLLLAGGWHIARHHEQDLVLYAPRRTVESVSRQEWISKGWRDLPAWRIDLAGEMEQPLTLQWAGDSEQITKRLLAEGWRRPPSLNLKNLLRMLSPNTPIENLPVLPRLHDGRVDSFRLVRRVRAQRWVLRLWRSDMTIAETRTPIFVGTIEVQDLRHMAGLITAARDAGDYDLPLDTLDSTLRNRFSVRSVRRDTLATPDRDENPQSRWKGRALLVWNDAE